MKADTQFQIWDGYLIHFLQHNKILDCQSIRSPKDWVAGFADSRNLSDKQSVC